jgi:hypothetical protein
MIKMYLSILSFTVLLVLTKNSYSQQKNTQQATLYYKTSKPCTRWWWFASTIKQEDIVDNLVWLANNGFGGVEIAWVYPMTYFKKDSITFTPRQKWQSAEWSAIVAFAKKTADSLQLSCDFTFGSLWPFGDTGVPIEDATLNYNEPHKRDRVKASWEYPQKGYVLDHLNKKAFYNYANRMGNALQDATKGKPSALFCDSWEVESKYLSTPKFDSLFQQKYHYDFRLYKDNLYATTPPYPKVRYDYTKLISELVINEFYKPFTEVSHKLGGFSRAQCSGAPCDILSAYATIDVPESEAMLYEPPFANIVASAAALSNKTEVTSETFTCLYGWPRDYMKKEQTADLKLVADALFANGVNQIFWHGKPMNPKGLDTVNFYASVHVGASGSLYEEIKPFNAYMQKISAAMKEGVSYSDVAVYLPTEDNWIAGEMPKHKQFLWSWAAYEHRYTYLPTELKAHKPLWINTEFLQKASYKNGLLKVGNCNFKSLYIDVTYMDINALETILSLAKKGLPICLKQFPQPSGFKTNEPKYKKLLMQLETLSNVKRTWAQMNIKPFLEGEFTSDYWCRKKDNELIFFVANPKSSNLIFPIQYGQALDSVITQSNIIINYKNKKIPVILTFKPYQSLLFRVSATGKVIFETLDFTPKQPSFIKREKKKEKWEVE